jgi:hypothetical protein
MYKFLMIWTFERWIETASHNSCIKISHLGWYAVDEKKMDKMSLLIGVFLLTAITYTLVAGNCSRYTAHIKDTSLQDRVISGHVLKTITGVNFGECFRHCGQTCHCRSFNLRLDSNGICELNDVDKEEAPRALRVRKGFIHVSFKALTEVSHIVIRLLII